MFDKRLIIKQTNIVLKCDLEKGIESAEKAIRHNRFLLEEYIEKDPFFQTTFAPYAAPDDAPRIVKMMARAGTIAGVGPMASVAGAISEIATDAMISEGAKFALAENGGDISAKGASDAGGGVGARGMTIAIYAGESPLSGKIGFKIKGAELPLGICTSSGTVGPSISLGDANAATIVARDASIADAVATAAGNVVKEKDPEGTIQAALELVEQIKEVRGALIIAGGHVGRVGKLPEIVALSGNFDIMRWV